MKTIAVKRPGRKPFHIKSFIGKFILYIFLVAVAVTCIIPFYSMIISSTHTNSNIATGLTFLPGKQFMANYQRLIDTVPIWRGFLNTIFLSVVRTTINLYFAALAGFGFAKYNFRGKNILFILVLATMMIPGQLGIIGFYQLVAKFNMLNTYWPLILPEVTNAFGIFFMRQMADANIPYELLESARMDGCGELRIFHRIALPMLIPALATLGIITFIGKWNEFLTAMITLFETNKQPIAVLIAGVKSQFSADFGAMYVGLTLSVVPVLIVFSIFSKQIMSSVTAGAIKG